MNNLEMPKFRPIYTKWAEKLANLEPRQFVVVDGILHDQSIRAACRRKSINGKRFCLHIENGIRTVWRVQ